MDETITIIETEGYLKNYVNAHQIEAVYEQKAKNDEILILPMKYSADEYYFAQETVSFVKFCRDTSDAPPVDILVDGDIIVRSLHSFDIWLPVIYIASNILLPVVVNLVSNFIYDKMKGREHEDANVNAEIVIKNGKKEKFIHFKGDAKSFKEMMDKIDLNK